MAQISSHVLQCEGHLAIYMDSQPRRMQCTILTAAPYFESTAATYLMTRTRFAPRQPRMRVYVRATNRSLALAWQPVEAAGSHALYSRRCASRPGAPLRQAQPVCRGLLCAQLFMQCPSRPGDEDQPASLALVYTPARYGGARRRRKVIHTRVRATAEQGYSIRTITCK